MEEEEAAEERSSVTPQLNAARKAKASLEALLTRLNNDWTNDATTRVIGHVVHSPPLAFSVGNGRYTEDWAIVEIDSSRVDKTNFVGNAIDLGTATSIVDMTAMMYPNPANPPSFSYPQDRLVRFHGTIADEEMGNPNPKTRDHATTIATRPSW
ncbi:hypothetical protein BT69DRAFT_1277062 [Atractiella rhizophila]|nr:hypothetical protein BT69DRAFT_1277062 [Atractiella rhizophila]